MPAVILFDYLFWNIIFSHSFGKATLTECVKDNLKQII